LLSLSLVCQEPDRRYIVGRAAVSAVQKILTLAVQAGLAAWLACHVGKGARAPVEHTARMSGRTLRDFAW